MQNWMSLSGTERDALVQRVKEQDAAATAELKEALRSRVQEAAGQLLADPALTGKAVEETLQNIVTQVQLGAPARGLEYTADWFAHTNAEAFAKTLPGGAKAVPTAAVPVAAAQPTYTAETVRQQQAEVLATLDATLPTPSRTVSPKAAPTKKKKPTRPQVVAPQPVPVEEPAQPELIETPIEPAAEVAEAAPAETGKDTFAAARVLAAQDEAENLEKEAEKAAEGLEEETEPKEAEDKAPAPEEAEPTDEAEKPAEGLEEKIEPKEAEDKTPTLEEAEPTVEAEKPTEQAEPAPEEAEPTVEAEKPTEQAESAPEEAEPTVEAEKPTEQAESVPEEAEPMVRPTDTALTAAEITRQLDELFAVETPVQLEEPAQGSPEDVGEVFLQPWEEDTEDLEESEYVPTWAAQPQKGQSIEAPPEVLLAAPAAVIAPVTPVAPEPPVQPKAAETPVAPVQPKAAAAPMAVAAPKAVKRAPAAKRAVKPASVQGEGTKLVKPEPEDESELLPLWGKKQASAVRPDDVLVPGKQKQNKKQPPTAALHTREKKKWDDYAPARWSLTSTILTILLALVLLLLIWVLFGMLSKNEILTLPDLGYSWFNTTFFPLF